MILVLEIGRVERFPTAADLASYAGLVPKSRRGLILGKGRTLQSHFQRVTAATGTNSNDWCPAWRWTPLREHRSDHSRKSDNGGTVNGNVRC
jgi:transposase